MKTMLKYVLIALLAAACSQKPDGNQTTPVTPSTDEVPAAKVGEPITPWQEGQFDIHFINTTTGECAFLIFPDGTQMIIDAAGSRNATGAVGSTTNTGIRARWDPLRDPDFRVGKFICEYIAKCMEWTGNNTIDYALLTHFHNDHFGRVPDEPVSDLSPTYVKQSFPEILDTYPVGKMMDRGWPDYDYPFDMVTKSSNAENVRNYVTAVKWHAANKNLKVERFVAGVSDQIQLNRKPGDYPDFKVRNLAVNGDIWDGGMTETATSTFPKLSEIVVAKTTDVANEDKCPAENHCSCMAKFTYGNFDYFAGGDAQYNGMSSFPWKDIETPVAKVCGQVDVMKADHHGVTNTNGYGFTSSVTGKTADAMKYLNPRCWIINSWTDGHPRQAVYEGVTGLGLDMQIFITNTCDAMRSYKNFNQVRSSDGHIVVRVEKGGKKYRVYTLTDSDGKMTVKNVAGPFISR